ncbi:hypothetical protein AMEX_G15810 [Astyanax mexicanus]|uniref:Uncharacterized protein n=1 Tax=Astyanax mexicanus TaxID=7994 RepID=A0A8T2LFM7_ASTMX|nr:hypothetical protein AMEX_G15810 [Astyanax mexicanus]
MRDISSASVNSTLYVYMQVSESAESMPVQSAINAVLALLLVDCFFIMEALNLLVKPETKECLILMVFSILSLLCSFVAFVLILVYAKQDSKPLGIFSPALDNSTNSQLLEIISSASALDNSTVAAQVLTGLAMSFCLVQSILNIILLFIGRTHELRRYDCFGFGVIAFVNLSLTGKINVHLFVVKCETGAKYKACT